jgi:ABC-type dipeptide/oligopeptide/nickel transport system ATPase component
MVEPVTTIIGGLAAARQAIDFLKQNVNAFNDARTIGQQIGQILQGHDEFNKARYDPKMAAKLGVKDVATDMIEMKLQQEELYSLRLICNNRFGSTFFDSVLKERERRIHEQKEAVKKAAAEKRKRKQEIFSILKAIGIAILVAGTLGVALLLFFTTKAN